MIEAERRLLQKLKEVFKEDDVFWNNEIKANIFVSFCLFMLCNVLGISFVLSEMGVFNVPKIQMRVLCAVLITVMYIAMRITKRLKGSTKWLKHYLCTTVVLVSFGLAATLNIFAGYILLVPVILSVRYYSSKFTAIISVVSGFSLFFAEIVYGLYGIVNLNLVPISDDTVLMVNDGLRSAVDSSMYDVGEYLTCLLRGSFAPRFLIFCIISLICYELAKRAHETVLEQEEISKKAEATKVELDMATNIQNAVIPKIFPAFPTHGEMDIRAVMYTAKEVGGDFYDFFLLDETHLGMVIADVSGKGIPAALFMMVAKTLIKNEAYNHTSPKIIAERVNNTLCDGNDVEMFVTVWIGILDLATGVLTAVNAGHENPIIRRKDGKYKVFKDPHGLVLAGMENMKYKEYTIQLEPGDSLFVYTDGVPEATNEDKELFGMKRLVDTLNIEPNASSEDILKIVKKEVDQFVGDEPQFDDLTMMSLTYIKKLDGGK